MQNWKIILGARLKQMREEAHKGKGLTHEQAAKTTGLTKSYVVRLETNMVKANPTLKVLEQLCTVYGRTMGDLFEPLVAKNERTWKQKDLHDKLDALLTQASENVAIAITYNIEAMTRMHRGGM